MSICSPAVTSVFAWSTRSSPIRSSTQPPADEAVVHRAARSPGTAPSRSPPLRGLRRGSPRPCFAHGQVDVPAARCGGGDRGVRLQQAQRAFHFGQVDVVRGLQTHIAGPTELRIDLEVASALADAAAVRLEIDRVCIDLGVIGGRAGRMAAVRGSTRPASRARHRRRYPPCGRQDFPPCR